MSNYLEKQVQSRKDLVLGLAIVYKEQYEKAMSQYRWGEINEDQLPNFESDNKGYMSYLEKCRELGVDVSWMPEQLNYLKLERYKKC